MNPLLRLALATALATTCGCVSSGPTITLDAVGPWQPRGAATPAETGTLVVYSAADTTGGPNDLETVHHSDYEIHRADGALLRRVANRVSTFSTEPATVELPPGRYVIAARANRGRNVTVPVLVEVARTTFVHLDDSELPGRKRAAAGALVTLPDGAVVGWRAAPLAAATSRELAEASDAKNP